MKNFEFIGIDVSSATLDVCIKVEGIKTSTVIENKTNKIEKFFKAYENRNVVVAMENTGRFNWPLYEVLASKNFPVYVIPPLHLKKSMGLVRGKNDKIDAVRIADFIEKNHQEMTQWKCSTVTIQKLKVLLTERNFRIKLKRQLLMQQHDYKLMTKLDLEKELLAMNKELICNAEKQVKLIEKKIEELIKTDNVLNEKANLIKSVPGVGKVLCWYLLAKTNGFENIDSPRKLACYSGIAPFEHQSGTSIYRKPRVSNFADKTLKSLLHLGAMTAIQRKNDLRVYYLRKVEEGKNKMSVLNAVRNKIIHRVYAVIKNQYFYKNNLVLS